MARMRYGPNPILESEADRILKESMRSETAHSSKKDILTPWKEMDRRRREVYVASGTPDPATRQGIFGRAVNPTAPHLNSIDGAAPSLGRTAEVTRRSEAGRTSSLASFVEEHLAG